MGLHNNQLPHVEPDLTYKIEVLLGIRDFTGCGLNYGDIAIIFFPLNNLKPGCIMAKLYFYYSAMNAGKTTNLLQSAHNYHERGMRTLILTPALDSRYGKGIVGSRIGLKAEGLHFDREHDLFTLTVNNIAAQGSLHCVLVDEAQFMTKPQVWQLSDIVDKLHIPVLAYGLRTDFRGELFEGSQYLLAWADVITEIKTICHSGKKATMVVRLNEKGEAVTEGPQVEIGGNERYVSVSRPEYKKLSNPS